MWALWQVFEVFHWKWNSCSVRDIFPTCSECYKTHPKVLRWKLYSSLLLKLLPRQLKIWILCMSCHCCHNLLYCDLIMMSYQLIIINAAPPAFVAAGPEKPWSCSCSIQHTTMYKINFNPVETWTTNLISSATRIDTTVWNWYGTTRPKCNLNYC